jgi:ATP synthase subunit 6
VVGSWCFYDWLFARSILIGGLLVNGSFWLLKKDAQRLMQRVGEADGDVGPKENFEKTRFFSDRLPGLVVLGLLLFVLASQVTINVIGLTLGFATVMVSVVIIGLSREGAGCRAKFEESVGHGTSDIVYFSDSGSIRIAGPPYADRATLLEKICAPYMTYTWMVMAFLIIVPKLTMGKLEMVPGSGQNFWEVMVGGLMDFCAENLGEKGAKMLFPMMATFFFYILIANMIGLIPGFMSPTSSLNITMAMTLIVWVTHHVLGFKYHGLHYYKHFMGPSKVLAPFMFLLELISNFARLISLSMRLFGNILAKEVCWACCSCWPAPFLRRCPFFVWASWFR